MKNGLLHEERSKKITENTKSDNETTSKIKHKEQVNIGITWGNKKFINSSDRISINTKPGKENTMDGKTNTTIGEVEIERRQKRKHESTWVEEQVKYSGWRICKKSNKIDKYVASRDAGRRKP